MNFEHLFVQFGQMSVAVVGDVMLDTYWWGRVDRISPEAPVPVFALNHREYRIGGAGNVALNTTALGAATTLFSVVGDDADADQLVQLLQQHSIDTRYLIRSKNRITTNKIRIVSKNQQMMRLDAEVTDDLLQEEEAALLAGFQNFVQTQRPAVVVFEDYNKGVLTASLIASMIGICKTHHILTTVDPKRKNFFAYQGVDLFKPNLKEVKEGLNLLTEEVSEQALSQIHDRLHQVLLHHISLITLSEKGIFFQKDSEWKIIPSHIRQIADVSGAGDTVIAVASLAYAATRHVALAAAMANIAGGLVCEKVGTAAIDPQVLLHECRALLSQG